MLPTKKVKEHNEKSAQDFLFVPNSYNNSFIKLDTIVYVEAAGLESIIHLNNGNQFTFLETINSITKKLPLEKFLVITNKYALNIAFINRYVQTDKNYIVMHDGTKIPIPTKRNKRLDDILKMLYFF